MFDAVLEGTSTRLSPWSKLQTSVHFSSSQVRVKLSVQTHNRVVVRRLSPCIRHLSRTLHNPGQSRVALSICLRSQGCGPLIQHGLSQGPDAQQRRVICCGVMVVCGHERSQSHPLLLDVVKKSKLEYTNRRGQAVEQRWRRPSPRISHKTQVDYLFLPHLSIYEEADCAPEGPVWRALDDHLLI
jgi:hypothetical protein